MSEDNSAPSIPQDEVNPTVQGISLEERELALKEREATLKEVETKHRLSLDKRNTWLNSSLLIALFTAIFGILGTAVGSILQGYWNFQLERKKFEFSLIQKSLETDNDRLITNHDDRTEAAKRLDFLLVTGIIENLDSDAIKKLAENPDQLPAFRSQSNGRVKSEFICKFINGTPTTVGTHQTRGDIPLIVWKSNSIDSPEVLCNKVSNKFQDLHNQDKLNYLTTGIIDGKSYICNTSKAGEPCENTLFELNPTDDPVEVLRDLMNINNGLTSSPLFR